MMSTTLPSRANPAVSFPEQPPAENLKSENLKFVKQTLLNQPRERVNVMLLGGDQPAMRSLHGFLRTRTKVTLAEDLPAALEKLAQQEVQVVFCAARFHCGSWDEALETISLLYPDLPVVVVNEASQDQKFNERMAAMFSAGAFDVLHDPQDELSVTVMLAHALATGEARQWQAVS